MQSYSKTRNDFLSKDDAIHSVAHRYIAYASDLGLKPGEWPDCFDTDLGNKLTLHRFTLDVRDGDIFAAKYRQDCGCIIVEVIND